VWGLETCHYNDFECMNVSAAIGIRHEKGEMNYSNSASKRSKADEANLRRDFTIGSNVSFN
jgi:hypothetical protein